MPSKVERQKEQKKRNEINKTTVFESTIYSTSINSTIVYPNMAMIVGEVDDYGSTQEGLLLVPLAMTNHNYTNSNNPTLSMNRKEVRVRHYWTGGCCCVWHLVVLFHHGFFSTSKIRIVPS